MTLEGLTVTKFSTSSTKKIKSENVFGSLSLRLDYDRGSKYYF